jgi:hypothetical protein
MPTKGNIAASSGPTLSELAIGAVVETVIVTTESPFPTGTCVGLKVHVVSAGNVEHTKVTLLGNVPVVGERSKL